MHMRGGARWRGRATTAAGSRSRASHYRRYRSPYPRPTASNTERPVAWQCQRVRCHGCLPAKTESERRLHAMNMSVRFHAHTMPHPGFHVIRPCHRRCARRRREARYRARAAPSPCFARCMSPSTVILVFVRYEKGRPPCHSACPDARWNVASTRQHTIRAKWRNGVVSSEQVSAPQNIYQPPNSGSAHASYSWSSRGGWKARAPSCHRVGAGMGGAAPAYACCSILHMFAASFRPPALCPLVCRET